MSAKTSLPEFHPIRSIAVLGEEAWVLHSSPVFDPSVPHKILLPGRYANPEKVGIGSFVPLVVEPYNPA